MVNFKTLIRYLAPESLDWKRLSTNDTLNALIKHWWCQTKVVFGHSIAHMKNLYDDYFGQIMIFF